MDVNFSFLESEQRSKDHPPRRNESSTRRTNHQNSSDSSVSPTVLPSRRVSFENVQAPLPTSITSRPRLPNSSILSRSSESLTTIQSKSLNSVSTNTMSHPKELLFEEDGEDALHEVERNETDFNEHTDDCSSHTSTSFKRQSSMHTTDKTRLNSFKDAFGPHLFEPNNHHAHQHHHHQSASMYMGAGNSTRLPGTPIPGLVSHEQQYYNHNNFHYSNDEDQPDNCSEINTPPPPPSPVHQHYDSTEIPPSGDGGFDEIDGNNTGEYSLPSEMVVGAGGLNFAADPDTLFFRDGQRRIDMVLVYEEEDQGVMTEAEARRREKRRVFQENLMREGLELELEHKNVSFDGRTWFLKVHLPWKTKIRYAAIMAVKLPIKRFITISVKAWDDERNQGKKITIRTKLKKIWNKFIQYNLDMIEAEPSFYEATKGADREEQFVVKDRVTSYSNAQRSLFVMQILLREKFDEMDKVGIRRLLNDKTYLACFPLHEGRWEKNEPDGSILDRRLLYLEWARPGKWMKKQPLALVRKYFGDKIALYFCWLGFYTRMLIPPAIVGTLIFFYGVLTIDSDDNIPTKEICDINGPGNITLCPLCDKACTYQKLIDSCRFARLTYLFDNPATVFFAIFMSLWATVFLELWRRKQCVIQWEWDLQGTDRDEEPRPEFETSVKTFRTNPVTREKEPYMPTYTKATRYLITGSVVFLMLAVVFCAVLGTIIYRLSLVTVIFGGGGNFFRNHAKILTSISAAMINLIIIMCLTKFYHRLAIYLTNIENPRTQTEYEDSYTFKIFLFEFMNFYSSLIYIAFFKGRFYEHPGDTISRSSEFLRVKGDVCDPAGCLSELCIQLAIIMVGKQVLNNIMELCNPKFYNWWRHRSHRSNTKDLTRKHTRWEKDYHLQDPGRLALFDEYLEMILQYGFVTLFVAAFPLAPLCALLNNIAEIRLDAYKMVTQARRPLAERTEDIGAWYGILRAITYTAVVSNAFVIAYTSDFIPRMVYKYKYSPTSDLVGYIDASLSTFNTSHYHDYMGGVEDGKPPPPICQYRGYRNGPDEVDPYGLSPQYWHVFAARLAFVVIFEHIVFALTGVMQYLIPDIPTELKTQIQRETLLAKEAKYEHGLKKNNDSSEFDDMMNAINENNNFQTARTENSRHGLRGSLARRFSRFSDGLEAHVEVIAGAGNNDGRKKTTTSTVWEVT